MLKIEIPSAEMFDERDNTFKTFKGTCLSLEHSLVSVSKWESKWCVPFLSKREKTVEETIDYIRCMTLTQNVDKSVYDHLTEANFAAIKEYINAPMSATNIKRSNTASREIVTSEIIYYWMVAFNIPFECQKWHLNRLLTLVSVCSIKQQTPKKMRGKSLAQSNSALNAKRRAMLSTNG